MSWWSRVVDRLLHRHREPNPALEAARVEGQRITRRTTHIENALRQMRQLEATARRR